LAQLKLGRDYGFEFEQKQENKFIDDKSLQKKRKKGSKKIKML